MKRSVVLLLVLSLLLTVVLTGCGEKDSKVLLEL